MLTTPSFIVPLHSLWHGGLLSVVRGHPGTGEDSVTEEKGTKKHCAPKVALLQGKGSPSLGCAEGFWCSYVFRLWSQFCFCDLAFSSSTSVQEISLNSCRAILAIAECVLFTVLPSDSSFISCIWGPTGPHGLHSQIVRAGSLTPC